MPPPFRLSVLDQSPISEGSSGAEALQNTLDLARLADRLGYHRYWVAEHHGGPMLAGPSPEALIGPIAAATTRLRVGSGGVMLPYYSPFKVAETFSLLAGLFPGPFLHIGGDEPYGMPDQAYGVYVRRLKQAAQALGKRTVGWQESIRAGADPGHVIQYWMDASSLGVGGEAPVPPEVAARVTANYRRARTDLEQALAHGVPVIVSPQAHCYFDVPYAEASADPRQRERRDHVGLRSYARQTLADTFDWEPVAELGPAARPDHIAGIGAALWCETVRDIDDLTFLLLPRLAGAAEKAWGAPGAVRWPEHRDALARHERLWAQDGLTFFSAART